MCLNYANFIVSKNSIYCSGLVLQLYNCVPYVQTNYGDIEFGFFPYVAPKTVEHIFKLVRLGCYNTNHFFRVMT